MEAHVFTSAITYRDPKAALAWLEGAFGFETTMAIEGPPDQPEMCHYEMSSAGQGRIMVGARWSDLVCSPVDVDGANTQSVHVHLATDVDAHCERARAAGARIISEPSDQFYGDRVYQALDLEGHCWSFSQTVRTVTKEEAEAALGQPIEATQWP